MRSRALDAGELKALVRQLVKAAGGVEACAVELGVSAERVSQYQRPTHDAQMSLLCILQLEAVVGQAIVTGAAARAVEGEGRSAIGPAVVEAVTRSAATLRLVSDMDADHRRDPGEIRQVQDAAQDHLRAAQRLADEAAALTPGTAA